MFSQLSGGEGGTAAVVIGAIGVLLTGVFAALFRFTSTNDARVDKFTVQSMETMAAARDDALAGEAQARAEGAADRARLIDERNRCHEERDGWMERWEAEQKRANRLEVELAQAKLRTTDPNGDAT